MPAPLVVVVVVVCPPSFEDAERSQSKGYGTQHTAHSRQHRHTHTKRNASRKKKNGEKAATRRGTTPQVSAVLRDDTTHTNAMFCSYWVHPPPCLVVCQLSPRESVRGGGGWEG